MLQPIRPARSGSGPPVRLAEGGGACIGPYKLLEKIGEEWGSIFGEASLQNVRPSRFSMAWRMRAGTGCDLLVW